MFYFVLSAMLLDGVTEALADNIALLRQLPKAHRVVLVAGLVAHHLDGDGYRRCATPITTICRRSPAAS